MQVFGRVCDELWWCNVDKMSLGLADAVLRFQCGMHIP